MKRPHPKADEESEDGKRVDTEKSFDFFSDHFCTNLEDTLSEKVKAGAEASKRALKSDLFDDCHVTINATAASNVVSSSLCFEREI